MCFCQRTGFAVSQTSARGGPPPFVVQCHAPVAKSHPHDVRLREFPAQRMAFFGANCPVRAKSQPRVEPPLPSPFGLQCITLFVVAVSLDRSTENAERGRGQSNTPGRFLRSLSLESFRQNVLLMRLPFRRIDARESLRRLLPWCRVPRMSDGAFTHHVLHLALRDTIG